MSEGHEKVRANVQGWIDAQGFPAVEADVSVEPSVPVSKIINVLAKAEHDVIGQAFNLYHGMKSLVVEAARA